MKLVCATLVALLVAPAAFAQTQEEVETYLVAPYTLNKVVTVTAADGKKVEGTVVGGDDDKIIVEQKTGRTELPINQIVTVRFRRPKRSAKIDFAGNMIGGMGFGFGGAALGKHAGEEIRGDGTPGRIGPIVGGVVLGFAGGYLGKQIARHAATEEVTLKVSQGVEGQAPKTGSMLLPVPAPNARVQPADLRR